MGTKVVNLYKAKYDVYIGRAGKGKDGYFGNPFTLQNDTPTERAALLVKYRAWFNNKVDTDPEFLRRVLELRGKTLGCFCHPKACHGHVIAEYVDSH